MRQRVWLSALVANASSCVLEIHRQTSTFGGFFFAASRVQITRWLCRKTGCDMSARLSRLCVSNDMACFMAGLACPLWLSSCIMKLHSSMRWRCTVSHVRMWAASRQLAIQAAFSSCVCFNAGLACPFRSCMKKRHSGMRRCRLLAAAC